MKHKRILKTAALAIAVTIAFAIFAYRAAEWSKGINSKMIVLGQGTFTGNPCPTGGTATGAVVTTKVIPQIAIGSFDGGRTKYTTIMQILNTSSVPQSVIANFYKENGTPLDNVTLTVGSSTITNGSFSSVNFPPDNVIVITGTGTATAGAIGWGKITACGNLSISTFFELRDGTTSVLYSRVGVAASPANLTSFVIPRVREVATGLDVGVALVNTSSTNATVSADLKDVTGARIKIITFEIGAGIHQAAFLKDIFAPLDEPTGRSYQYVKFTSNSPSLAAIALAFEGPTQASFPVDVLQ